MKAKDVWVIAEYGEGKLEEVTFEMLSEGGRLAESLGQKVCAVLIGYQVSAMTDILAHYGADKVYLVEDSLLADYDTEVYAHVITDLVKKYSPYILVLGATTNGSDLAPRVAARLRTGLVSGCTMLKINEQGVLEVTKPVYEDRIYSTVVFETDALPKMATIRPGAIGLGSPVSSRPAELVKVQPHIRTGDSKITVISTIDADPKKLDLTEAKVIVAGGAGVGSEENWKLVEELANVLIAVVGGSRVALDAGWIDREHLIGQSGKTVKPSLYIALGISGASHHTVGMKDSERIIAVNKDRSAPIFKLANMSIVCDLTEVIPMLIEKIRQYKESDSEDSQSQSS